MILDTLLLPILINAACASFDGGAALYSHNLPPIDPGQPPTVLKETGPVKFLTGPYPTVQSFLLAGAAEVLVLTAVSYGLKRAGLKRYWWIPQISIAAYHGYLGCANWHQRNIIVSRAQSEGIL